MLYEHHAFFVLLRRRNAERLRAFLFERVEVVWLEWPRHLKNDAFIPTSTTFLSFFIGQFTKMCLLVSRNPRHERKTLPTSNMNSIEKCRNRNDATFSLQRVSFILDAALKCLHDRNLRYERRTLSFIVSFYQYWSWLKLFSIKVTSEQWWNKCNSSATLKNVWKSFQSK